MSSEKNYPKQCATTYVFPASELVAENERAGGRVGTATPGGTTTQSASMEGNGEDSLDFKTQPILQPQIVHPQGFQIKLPLTRTTSSGAGVATTSHSDTGNVKDNQSSSGSSTDIQTGTSQANPTNITSNPISSSIKHPIRSALKGHSRSASHGGVAGPRTGLPTVDFGPISKPPQCPPSTVITPLPSAMKKGHTRAASHGQIVEDSSNPVKGHNRVLSRTEFTLPPGHVERERPATGPAAWEGGHKKGHSRQASRTESIYTLRSHRGSTKRNKLFFWKTKPVTEAPKTRTIVPNHCVPPDTPQDQHPNGKYPTNLIRTTKYTLISFLPKNLFEQFHRFANLYFISIVLLNWIPAISAFGKEIAMLPVMFVLGVTAIKDLFEDRRRHNSDKRVNNATCRVYNR